jgi:two-component system chemotaxis sensor kinase CheA
LDLAKYRAIFVEEATEHLAEISRALLELEKDPERAETIDLVFRMAHSIKGMAASLEYDAVAELAHALEDRMQKSRAAARMAGEELAPLFLGLEGLEAMLAVVRDTGEPPPPRPELVRELSRPPGPDRPAAPEKKAPGPPRRARVP